MLSNIMGQRWYDKNHVTVTFVTVHSVELSFSPISCLLHPNNNKR
jgi:hypothetical protein